MNALLPDPQTQGPIVSKPEPDDPKAYVCAHQAQRPVLDEVVRVRPDPWPSPSVVIVDLDTCSGSVIMLEG